MPDHGSEFKIEPLSVWRIFKHLTAPLGERNTDPYRNEIIDLLLDYEDAIVDAKSPNGDMPPWYKRRIEPMIKLILHPDFRDDLYIFWKCDNESTLRLHPLIKQYFIDSYSVDDEVADIFAKFACGAGYEVLNPYRPPVRLTTTEEIAELHDKLEKPLLLEVDVNSSLDDIEWILRNRGMGDGGKKRSKSPARYSVRDMAIYILRKQKLGHAEIDRQLMKYDIPSAKGDDELSPEAIYKVVERLKPKTKSMIQARIQMKNEDHAVKAGSFIRILEFDSESSGFVINYQRKNLTK